PDSSCLCETVRFISPGAVLICGSPPESSGTHLSRSKREKPHNRPKIAFWRQGSGISTMDWGFRMSNMPPVSYAVFDAAVEAYRAAIDPTSRVKVVNLNGVQAVIDV